MPDELPEPSHIELTPIPEFEPLAQGHVWMQRGIEVRCTSCPREHGFYIRPDQMLRQVDGKLTIVTLD